MKNRITYPYLLECCNYTNDAYWKSIFSNLSCGVPPNGVYIHKDYLVCNYKDKSFSYKLQNKNSEELFNEIYTLFKTNLQMISRDDILQKQNIIDNLNKKIVYNNWSDIKRKNTKDLLLEDFVLDMKNKHNLDYKYARDLLNIINIGITFKYINCKDIIMENGAVQRITCLSEDTTKDVFKNVHDMLSNNCNGNCKNTLPVIFKMDTSLSKEWDKYIQYYKKLFGKSKE